MTAFLTFGSNCHTFNSGLFIDAILSLDFRFIIGENAMPSFGTVVGICLLLQIASQEALRRRGFRSLKT